MSGSNQPPFDPLHPTDAEQEDMLRGYREGYRESPATGDTLAYAHGRRNGVNDRLRISEPEQIALARRARLERGG